MNQPLLPEAKIAVPAAAPIHVVHVIESLGPGGAERLLYTNLKYSDGVRFRHTVVTLYDEGTHWAEPVRELGIPVISLGARGHRDVPAAVFRLWRWLNEYRPDLVHSHLWTANMVGRAAGWLARIPVISSVHGVDHDVLAWNDGSDVPIWKRRLQRYMDRVSARLACERLIAVSDFVRQSTHAHLGFPLDRIDLVFNPIDIDEIDSLSAKSRKEVRRDLRLPSDSIILLHVGRVSPEKGLLSVVQALPELVKRYPQLHLVSAGALSNEVVLHRLRDEASDLDVQDRLHFLGPRRDVPALLQACDIFVFPSLHEGLGIALVEAMAAGCACVASDMGPIPELVESGVNGWLVPVRDPKILAETVIRVLSDSEMRERVSAAAAESARLRFAPRDAVANLNAIYEKVARPRVGAEAQR